MAKTIYGIELAGAKDCPFCGSDSLFFQNGSVACDKCQTEGPFHSHFHLAKDEAHLDEMKIEAVRLWNLRGDNDWQSEDG